MHPFIQGVIIGFSIAAPVGPIGLLCIRRAMNHGRVSGFVSGLGAATADALYGVVAALGLTAITQAVLAHRDWLQLGGGLFLVWLGIATIRGRPASDAAQTRQPTSSSLVAQFGSTLALTLSNPMTILSFLGIFAGMGLGAASVNAWRASLLVGGVFVGSAAWWLLLSATASWIGGRIQGGGLRTLNIFSGVVIGGFGAWQLLALAR
jgi:threonine/homoserine/homoserine lactone efflux protein